MSKYYVVETVEGIAINVIECPSDGDARGTFEVLARENCDHDDDADELEKCAVTGIYCNGDYVLSILAVD